MTISIRLLGLLVSLLISLAAIFSTLMNVSYSTLLLHNLSALFIILTSLIFPVALLASYNNLVHNELTYYSLMILLELILLYLFITDNVILFYVTFELSLLPLYLLIGLFGASQARVRASLLLWSYTMLGSVSLLISLIWLLSTTGVSDYSTLNFSLISYPAYTYNTVWLLFAIGLAIKVPSVPLHIWLTRAHVEANVSTSVILAAVILKLSTYGTIVLLLLLLPSSSAYYSSLWLLLGLISYLHASFSTLCQIDSKVLIAYSSVAHMSIITIGLHSNHYLGLLGGLLLAIAHASSSSALFIIFGQVLYDRTHTRVLYYMRNITNYSPSLRTTLLFATVCNAGTPSTLNWIAEWYALLGVAHSNLFVSIILASTVLLTASYSFWLYSYTTSQIATSNHYILFDLTSIELTSLLYLLVPNILVGLNVWLIESYLLESTVALMY